MEQVKYYTPEIEELFVGYEWESRIKDQRPKITYQDISVYEWTKRLITLDDFSDHDLAIDRFNIRSDRTEFRTKYLDKEDIEKEGYVYKGEYKNKLEFEKGDVNFYGGQFLNYNLDTKLLIIIKNKGKFDNSGTPTGQYIFEGICKSINEFRKILKWIK